MVINVTSEKHENEAFLKIPTKLARALARTNLSAYESRIVWYILIQTYGWNKKLDRISYSQFEEATQLKRFHVWRAINLLLERNIILRTGKGYSLEYGVQPDTDIWKDRPDDNKSSPKGETKFAEKLSPQPHKIVSSYVKSSPKMETKSSPETENTIEPSNILQKHINTKEDGGGVPRNVVFNKGSEGESIRKKPVAKRSLEEYSEELRRRERFSGLDFDLELEKFWKYWSEGTRKLARPKFALLNWMVKATKIQKQEELRYGVNRGYSQPEASGGLRASVGQPLE